MKWIQKHPQATLAMLGFLPSFISDLDPRPARDQFDTAYRHGGGWNPFQGFRMLPNGDLQYPGDPPVKLLWETQLRSETIRSYEHSWVAIIQPDHSCEICRMD